MEETSKLIDDMISETLRQPDSTTIADTKMLTKSARIGRSECWRKRTHLHIATVSTRLVRNNHNDTANKRTSTSWSSVMVSPCTSFTRGSRLTPLRNHDMVGQPLVTQFHIDATSLQVVPSVLGFTEFKIQFRFIDRLADKTVAPHRAVDAPESPTKWWTFQWVHL